MRVPLLRIPIRRISRQRAGAALLVAAVVLLATGASLRYFAWGSPRSAGAGPVGLTPTASPAGAAAQTGPNSAASRASGPTAPATGGRSQASKGAVGPPAVSVAGPAALPSAHVRPGYYSPADAVDGFYLALLSGTPARACAYVANPCPSLGSRPITGRVTVTDAMSHGREALVQVTGTICVGISCVPLTDLVMMPIGPASFSASWSSLTRGMYGWAASPLPCVQDPTTGQWRVKLH